jgi:hypothetical protein
MRLVAYRRAGRAETAPAKPGVGTLSDAGFHAAGPLGAVATERPPSQPNILPVAYGVTVALGAGAGAMAGSGVAGVAAVPAVPAVVAATTTS